MAEPLSIEDIILEHDCRGISALRPFLPHAYCREAAQFIMAKRGGNKAVLITTGFYILSARAPETDGPPGAIALADALERLGFEISFVTDRYCMPLLTAAGQPKHELIEFPITGHAASRDFAAGVLARTKPALVIAVERCGFTAGQRYLNMRGKDISEFTAKIDYLFLSHEDSIGIGDGGNEIGMGNLAAQIREIPGLPAEPAVTRTKKLVIASVSNWGAYGLIAALSRLSRQDLLPSVAWEQGLLKEIVARGAVDGVSGESKCAVDAFDIESNACALTELRRLLRG